MTRTKGWGADRDQASAWRAAGYRAAAGVGQALWLVGAGIAVGLGGALALTRVLGALLYDVSPTGPATFGAAAALLGAVALAAGYFPGRRAMRVDPTGALPAD